MPDEYLRGVGMRAPREEPMFRPEREGPTTRPSGAGPSTFAASLVGDPRINGRGNGAPRAAALRNMQQSHGNRAVQRAMSSRSQLVPVQRDDEKNQPSFRPWLPELDWPFGGGYGFKGTGKGIGLDLGPISGGLGYDYGGGFSLEGGLKTPWGKGSAGLEFDPWKKEGSAGFSLGGLHAKGSVDDKGWGVGFGYGSPLITPPGLPASPADPSKDWRKGEVGPGMFGPPGDISKKQDPWGIGFGFGRSQGTDPNSPGPGWWAFGGLQGVF